MASYQFFIAALVLVLVQQCCCQNGGPTQISTIPNPPQLTLTPSESDITGGRISLECKASSILPGNSLRSMTIQRVLHTNPNAGSVSIAGASSSKNQGLAAVTSSTPQGANVTGGTGDSSITLIMNRVNCGDAGTYYCIAYSENDDTFATTKYENQINVTVRVSPGIVNATSDPSGTTNWAVNQTLLMRCNSIVGTVADASQLEWIWQYQDTNGFPALDNWQRYDNIGVPDTDIRTYTPVNTNNQCYKRQISELTRRLTEDDTDRLYRCYVANHGMSGELFAQDFTVGTVTLSGIGPGTPGPSTGDGSGSPAKADVGAIVGGVIGALIVVVVIIVIVYFLVIRKRRQQDKPDPSKPADEQPPPGYSTGPDPHVTYSQPTRTSNNRFKKEKEDKARGQTNKAMDDTDEKPHKTRHSPQPQDYDSKPAYESKPARYENDIGRDYDRNQGRRNRAYDDDAPRTPRRYSSDDGGTDTNVNMNTSMHSMHSVGRGDPNIGTAI